MSYKIITNYPYKNIKDNDIFLVKNIAENNFLVLKGLKKSLKNNGTYFPLNGLPKNIWLESFFPKVYIYSDNFCSELFN